jgi:hypothetical protein
MKIWYIYKHDNSNVLKMDPNYFPDIKETKHLSLNKLISSLILYFIQIYHVWEEYL